jgi:hypothetical protein
MNDPKTHRETTVNDTRDPLERAADALTGDDIDDKTGKVVNDEHGGAFEKQDMPPPVAVDLDADERVRRNDWIDPDTDLDDTLKGGTADEFDEDTRGPLEKTADAITGDVLDDKTGRIVDR